MTGTPLKVAAVKVKLLENATLAGLQTDLDTFLLSLTEELIFGPVRVCDVGGKYVAIVNYTE